MKNIYKIEKYLYNEFMILQPPEITNLVRNDYHINRNKYRKEVIQNYYKIGYFDNIPLTVFERRCLRAGHIPIRNKRQLFNIHHIKPISLGGTNDIENLIPLPPVFHQQLHNNIINPQLINKKYGNRILIKHLPNFKTIPLEWFYDDKFIKDYNQVLIDDNILSQKKLMKLMKQYEKSYQ